MRGFGVVYGSSARDRAGEQLEQIGDAAGDRAADVVGVVALEVGRRRVVAREDAIAKAGREALDLALDAVGDDRPSSPAGHVAVGVAGVLARRARASDRTGSAGTTSTNGRSGCSPRHTAASAAAISSSVPPTCTVDASRQRGSRHGIGPSSAQSSLNDAGPVAIAAQPAQVAGAAGPARRSRRAGPGWCRTDRPAPAAGRRASGRARPVSIAAAERGETRSRARRVIACEPPAATGQSST